MTPLLLSVLIVAAPGHRARTSAATGTEAAVPPDVSARVNAYLGAIDTPIPESRWRALGEPGVIALEQIARSHRALPTRRARAVAAAGIIGGARARSLALELLDPASAPSVVRQSAVRVVGRLTAPEELGRLLGPVLRADPSLGVRGAAAEVLAARAPGQCATIERQAASEDASRRPAFERALRRCGSSSR